MADMRKNNFSGVDHTITDTIGRDYRPSKLNMLVSSGEYYRYYVFIVITLREPCFLLYQCIRLIYFVLGQF